MIWAIATLFLVISPPIPEEIKEFAGQAEKQIDGDAAAFLLGLVNTPKKECSKCLPNAQSVSSSNSPSLKVFMSFSVPMETWKDFSKQLEQMNGVFVLRGIPGNSFKTLSQKVIELRAAGVNAPLQIDPEIYEKYHIDAVPAFVMEDGAQYDRVVGNIRLEHVLKIFSENSGSNSSVQRWTNR